MLRFPLILTSLSLSLLLGCATERNESDARTGAAASAADAQGGTDLGEASLNGVRTAGDHLFKVAHAGVDYRYIVHVPTSYSPSAHVPVILNLHGGGGNAEQAESSTGMNAGSERYGYIVVYPQGLQQEAKASGKSIATWNAGLCCGDSVKKNTDDVGFFRKLIAEVTSNYEVDAQRIYATGISNGGMMSYRLACELSDKIAAIAPIAATNLYGACAPARPVPLLDIQGKLDRCVPFEGGPMGDCFSLFLKELTGIDRPISNTGDIKIDSKPDALRTWNELNGVSGLPQRFYQKASANCFSYGGGAMSAQTVSCVIGNMGHSWPNGEEAEMCKRPNSRMCKAWRATVGEISHDLDANETMWRFFQQHKLP